MNLEKESVRKQEIAGRLFLILYCAAHPPRTVQEAAEQIKKLKSFIIPEISTIFSH